MVVGIRIAQVPATIRRRRMPNFNILATNHTSFTVSNLDRTVAFFRDALGFDVTSKAPRNPSLIERITGVEGVEVMIAYVRGSGHSL